MTYAATSTFGHTVDWERRVDVDGLHDGRLRRLREQLESSELGAVLAFDFTNIRYMTATTSAPGRSTN